VVLYLDFEADLDDLSGRKIGVDPRLIGRDAGDPQHAFVQNAIMSQVMGGW
jgi:hypothetical protein